MGGKTNARVLYGLMFFAAIFVLSFMLWMYLREDGGAGVIRGVHKKCFCGCLLHRRLFKTCCKCCHNEKRNDLHRRMKNSDQKSTASQVNGQKWFRPEKFKILLSFVQIFSQVKQNYGK